MDGQKQMKMMIESSTLARVSAYMDESWIKETLEADFQQRMDFEANTIENNKTCEMCEHPIL